jgi:hypothetical protein
MPADATLESLASAHFPDARFTEAEIELVRKAGIGGVAVCGPNMNDDELLNDPAKSSDWGPERHIRAALIRWICVDVRARKLVDPYGIRIYGAKINDVLDLSNVIVTFGLTLWQCHLAAPTILQSAELARLDFQGSRVDSVDADRVSVKGPVFLRRGFKSDRGIRFAGARIGGDLDCSGSTIANPAETEPVGTMYALNADLMVVNGSVRLCDGFTANGEVRLVGAQIGGSLDCTRGAFQNPPEATGSGNGIALNADRVVVRGEVFLNKGFKAVGQAWLVGAEIGGSLNCDNAVFENAPRRGIAATGCAFAADRAAVRGSVFLKEGFHAKGTVRLVGIQVGRNLDCAGSTFENPFETGVPGSGIAFALDGAVVKGSVFLNMNFKAKGNVRLMGVQIGSDLVCDNATFDGAVCLESASVEGSLYWVNIAKVSSVTFDLIDASVDALVDDPQSWPALGRLLVDGFVYRRISGNAPRDARTRLDWLARQDGFAPQPYRQLAKVLNDEGDDVGARDVLFEMESRQREQEDQKPMAKPHPVIANLLSVRSLRWILKPTLKWYRPLWSWTLRKTVGYGYHSVWALWWLLGLVIIWSAIYSGGYLIGSMVPTGKDAYYAFRQDRQSLPAYYEHFHATVYSLENSFPFVKLGQVDRWQPDPSPRNFLIRIWHWPASFSFWISAAGFIRWLRWVQILLGWILATLFVAGVTGIVRRD